ARVGAVRAAADPDLAAAGRATGVDPRVVGQVDPAAGDDRGAALPAGPARRDVDRAVEPRLVAWAGVDRHLAGSGGGGAGVDPARRIDDVFEDAGDRVGGQKDGAARRVDQAAVRDQARHLPSIGAGRRRADFGADVEIY